MSKWNQENVGTLIKDILDETCKQTGVSMADIGDDDDLYANGIIDSYGLVDLLAELESKTGLAAEWHLVIPDDADTDTPVLLSINRLSQALVQN